MFSKKATKIDEIFTVDLTLCSKCQILGEDFVKFCGLLRKHELYLPRRQRYTLGILLQDTFMIDNCTLSTTEHHFLCNKSIYYGAKYLSK